MGNMQQQQQYHAPTDYGDMPVDPQIMQSMHEWQQTQEDAVMHDAGAQASSSSQRHMAALDGDGVASAQDRAGGGAGGESMTEDVGVRLREELEAQMLNDERVYARELRERNG